MKHRNLRHQFVHHIPEALDEATVYVSIEFCVAVHRCFCGCGNEVVTPLAPTGWTLAFDGASVSLRPSIGSWSLPCRSHYWIEKDTAIRARGWSEYEIEEGRSEQRRAVADYYAEPHCSPEPPKK
jgi:hypothetical protein